MPPKNMQFTNVYILTSDGTNTIDTKGVVEVTQNDQAFLDVFSDMTPCLQNEKFSIQCELPFDIIDKLKGVEISFMKIKKVDDIRILFDNGSEITFDHVQECCEYNYADFEQLDDVARAVEFQQPI